MEARPQPHTSLLSQAWKEKEGRKIVFVTLLTITCFEKFMNRGSFSADWDMPVGAPVGFFKHSKVEIISYIMNSIEFYTSALLKP